MTNPMTETSTVEDTTTQEVLTPFKSLLNPQSLRHKILVVVVVYLMVGIF